MAVFGMVERLGKMRNPVNVVSARVISGRSTGERAMR
jgi:hypothetical protein